MWSGALIGDGAGRRETGRGLGEFFGAVGGIPFGLSVFPEIMDIKGYETCQ